MKKLFVAFLILILVFALLGAGIMTFISYVWGGYRLTPEAAVEAVSLTASEKAYIDADGFRFYYDTEDGREGYISDIYIVKRGELRLKLQALFIEQSDISALRRQCFYFQIHSAGYIGCLLSNRAGRAQKYYFLIHFRPFYFSLYNR